MDRFVRERGSYGFGRFRVDAARRTLTRDGAAVALTPTLFDTLLYFVENPARVITKEELLAAVWPGRFVEESNLTQTIFMLRKVLRNAGNDGPLIVTAPRRGYRFTADVRKITGSASPDTASAAIEPLLAVLAFDNLCDGEDMAWFSDGVSEEILQTVARTSPLKVIGRGSSFHFRGAEKAARHISTSLRATHILDGSVRRSGSTVRISAHLVECASETTLWSNRFDRELSDILVLQDEIAEAIAGALKIAFSGGAAAGQIDATAYDLYLKACAPAVGAVGSHAESIALLERTVSLAPRFALAWGELARMRSLVHRGISLDEKLVTVSRSDVVAAAEMALRLDPVCATASMALAQLLPWADYRGREAMVRKAIQASLHNPQAIVDLGWLLAAVGRTQEALGLASRALELDPFSRGGANMYSQLLTAVGRYEEGKRSYAHYRDKWPAAPVFAFVPMGFAALAGDWAEFDRLAAAAEDSGISGPHVEASLAMGRMLRDPSPAKQERILQVLHKQLNATGTVGFMQLIIACRMGLGDAAFSIIESASFRNLWEADGAAPAATASPGMIFDETSNHSMMQDPRFVGFCAKIGLCDYWVETDHWPDCADQVGYDFRAEVRQLASTNA